MDKPTMDEQSIQQAAATLVQARRTMQPIANLPDACRPATVADAHAIQDAITAAFGTAVGAYKANAPADGEPNRGVIYARHDPSPPRAHAGADVPPAASKARSRSSSAATCRRAPGPIRATRFPSWSIRCRRSRW